MLVLVSGIVNNGKVLRKRRTLFLFLIKLATIDGQSKIPAFVIANQHTEYCYNYTTDKSENYCLAYNNGSCFWPRGRMIGGTGGLNGMIYLRGNSDDYNNWNVEGWSYNDVLPYFEKSPQFVDGIGLYLDHFSYIDPLAKTLKACAEDIGQQFFGDYIETDRDGYFYIWANQKDGRRMSTGKTYLSEFKDKNNLKVLKHARVIK
uniref:Glucose-methanol-choline oxidoreductase N-terminal domain-containing protein n=1 Tax=Megaselia scalaris TaxID=36166 RepID=T1GRM2_MEGSC